MAPLRIVVNADDLGLSEAVNDAILEALRRGWCSSTSLLANGPALERAAKSVGGDRGLDIGLHLNMTEFEALSSLAGLEDLLPDRRLGPRVLAARPRHREAILREWRAQLARVRALGIEPTHLDTHQHLHWRPVFREALRALAVESGVRRVRGMGAFRPHVGRVRRGLQRLRAARFRCALRRGDPPLLTTDHFASVNTFRAILEGGGRLSGTLELMAHPGNPAHARYAEELSWLAGPWRERAGAVLISWRQLS